MATDIESEFVRIDAALKSPTLRLLDRKSAAIAMPIFTAAFPDDAQPIPVERFHTRVEALLTELSAAGYSVPAGDGKSLAMQWVRERWLYRDSGRGEETYQLTGDAKQAIEYVTRTTRVQLNVSASRIETMRRVISEAAQAANPDRDERKRRLSEEIAVLQSELDRLEGGGEVPRASEAELVEQFANVLREIDGLPSDFRRVEEAVRDMHKVITKKFREEEHPVGQVLDDYLDQAKNLLTSTPEGRAFAGAQELLRNREVLSRLRADLESILASEWAVGLLPEEQRQLRSAVDVIRRGRDDVIDQRQRLSATLREHIENYDHIKNRELDRVLRGLDREMRTWMQSARPRDHVDVELMPPALDVAGLKIRTFDPDSERAPEPLEDVSADAPPSLSLDEIRKKGGPSLRQLQEKIDARLLAGEIATAAALFNQLPHDLRRPVEVLGLLHLLARIDAHVDSGAREPVFTIRPDGSTRRLRMPVVTVRDARDAEVDAHD
ncbi:DUF3375 family protein [Tsukamurella tyrosinosolvens]|uniref:DUF3375 family protein n=1 Tax=Tsukamurella tyrosinosolvens TaxID=57704 RepID=UPI000794882C|nr:DUF3375 family protein [Tsukamurella tyrosinosolvens]KXP08934.1 hypothetical protein AXK59_00510 [Tsukamurella tyrosinosolvens]KZL97162.1 hypothetical protein AXX05_17050 [Tsukamurella tyrosinosolvens]MCA4996947.1 DUF3375 family protein [Tsukamurella tyrosinosolvens]